MGRVVRAVSVICLLWLTGNGITARTQERSMVPSLPLRPKPPDILSFISPFLIPKLIQDGYRLKEFIRSDEFAGEKRRNGDLYGVDRIFDEALRLGWNNMYEALLITFVAVMDHNKVGVRVPFLGPLLWIPLTSEFPVDFNARLSALPVQLYPDTPKDAVGDRDKLQHFFGSALLTYVTESPATAERVGSFVEWGEEEFIVGGTYDERDLRANRHGQVFARRLLVDPDARPSAVFLEFEHIDTPAPGADSVGVSHPDSLHVLLEVK